MFSVIIPLYNKAPYIQRAIDSVLDQTFSDYEIIVINDGSTDGGEQIVLNKYGNKILLINQTNQGVSVARNQGISRGINPWVAFLDADDSWHPKYLESINQAILKNPEIFIFGTSYTNKSIFPSIPINPHYEILNNYFQRAILNTFFFTSASVVKKTFFDLNDGFDSDLSLGEDLDLFFRVNLHYQSSCFIPYPLVYYCQEDSFSEVKKNHFIEKSLVSKILTYRSNNEIPTLQWKSFTDFRVKWTLFNLFPFFLEPKNKEGIQKILKETKGLFPLVQFFYQLNFSILNKLFQFKFFANLFRNYMKFCFRYIYT